jgi:pimeloyl-ACP methyl ester carboxylesterase
MHSDTEGLHPIANTVNPGRTADIVFVHGLAGGSHSTWTHGKEGKSGHFFWPAELGNDLPTVGVWTLGHASGISHWFSSEGMALEDRANNFALKLANHDFGARPMILVTHSMGGLVAKELVTAGAALGGANWTHVVDSVRGIVFLGTPHHGSHMATVAKGFAALLRTQTHLQQMTFAGRGLDQLHKRFVKWRDTSGCAVESFVETQGIARHGWLGLARFFPRVQVVPAISGDPNIPGGDCHRVAADHTTLVKPSSRHHDVYVGVRRFLERVFSQPPRGILPHEISAASAFPTTPESKIPFSAVERRTDSPQSGTATPIHADISRILKYAPAELIGRDAETKVLDEAWAKVRAETKPRAHVLTFVSLGGEGKTSLVAKWSAALASQDWPGCESVFAWSFYSQGTREQLVASSDLFLKEALIFFGDSELANSSEHASEKGKKLAVLIGERRCLLILDGLEPLQYPTEAKAFKPGALKDDGIARLLKGLATSSRGLCLVTTRIALPDLDAFKGSTVMEQPLDRLSRPAGVDLLK